MILHSLKMAGGIKMKVKIALIAMIVLAIKGDTSGSPSGQALLPALLVTQLTGKIKGTVSDDKGSLSHTIVTLEGGDTKREVITDQDGTYEIEAPPGIYRVYAEYENEGVFCPSRRPAFRLRAATITVFNFNLTPCGIAHGRRQPNSPYVNLGYVYPYKEEIIQITSRDSPDKPSELMIRYGKRQEENNSIEYKEAIVSDSATDESRDPIVGRGTRLPVMVSYDVLTIYASSVCLDPKTLRLVADGDDVIVEDGQRRMHVRHAEVDFKASAPLATLIKR